MSDNPKDSLFGTLIVPRGQGDGASSDGAETTVSLAEIPETGGTDLDAIVSSSIAKPGEHLETREEIGSGGMGTIRVAFNRSLLRTTAKKLLHSKLRTKASAVRRFIHEAQITGQLEHPNIVPVHEIGVDESGDIFFTMKLVQGQDLAKLLREERLERLNPSFMATFLEIMVKVCDAVAFAHSRGVVHLDIKAENIMVGDFGQVYLMDWGIAQVLLPKGGVEEQQFIVGTPVYMPPEQAYGRDEQIDSRADVFTLGSLLYEYLTAKLPFPGASALDALKAAQRCQPIDPNDATTGIVLPRELRRICKKSMAAKREERYQSVLGLKDDIVRFMRGGLDFPRRKYEAGETIISEGEVGDAAYIIASGECRVTKLIEGEQVELRVMGAGEVFGETAILISGPRTASVVATTATTLLVVTANVLEHEVDSMKPWMGAFIRTLADRFREGDRHRAAIATNRDPWRIANHVLMYLHTWGYRDPSGTVVSRWSSLCSEIQLLYVLDEAGVVGFLEEIEEIEIDEERDLVTISNLSILGTLVRSNLNV